MPFCPNCGKGYAPGEKFCNSCGQQLPIITTSEIKQTATMPSAEKIEDVGISKVAIDPTSRLSGQTIDKYLLPGERVLYSTKGEVWFGNQRRRAHVTNRRMILYRREGVPITLGLIKNEKLDEIDLRMIKRASLVETGLISKKVVLHLDDIIIQGDRGDIINIYNNVQKIRGS